MSGPTSSGRWRYYFDVGQVAEQFLEGKNARSQASANFK